MRTTVRIHAVNVRLTLVARIIDAIADRQVAIPASRLKRRVTVRRREPVEVRRLISSLGLVPVRRITTGPALRARHH
jgi:hypothetical protein